MSQPSTRAARIVVRAVVILSLFALPVAAQSNGDLAAFGALMVSPMGALPPLARDEAGGLPFRNDLSIRYGGWQFDVDDGVHNNIGATYTQRVGGGSTTVGLTGTYISLDCACNVWVSGGVAIRSTMWSGAQGGAEAPGFSGHFALQAQVAGARYTGAEVSTAYSAGAALDVGGGIPLLHTSRLAVSVLPGVALGHLNSPDLTGSGFRFTMGAALSLSLPAGFALDAGTHRVLLAGGPTQVGAGLSWHHR